MSSRTFTQATDLLTPFVPVSGRHALTNALLQNGGDVLGQIDYTPDRAIENIAMKFHEIVDGGQFIYDLCLELEELMTSTDLDPIEIQNSAIAAKKFSKEFVRVTLGSIEMDQNFKNKDFLNNEVIYDPTRASRPYTLDVSGIKDTVNGSINTPASKANIRPDKTRPSLVAVEFLNPRTGMSVRDSSSVGIFTSIIPSHELSRCVPYLNIKVQSSDSSASVYDGKLNGLSLMTYLLGKGERAPISGLDSFLTFDSSGLPLSSSMEVFTSPQTLAPVSSSPIFRERDNIPAVLDRFRPFMSLKGLSINVLPTKGFMSYKSGKLELTLHDRSRLGEISAFVKPGVYQGTELDIEYGWSHPDGKNVDASNTPIGSFLNGMKVKEKYSVVNSTFNFDEAGQANVTLTIAMKGAMTLNYVDISECQSSSMAIALQNAIDQVKVLKEQLVQEDSEKFASIFDSTIINPMGSANTTLSLNEETLLELRSKIDSLLTTTSGVDLELTNLLNEIVKPGGIAEQYTQTADEAVRNELNALEGGLEIFPCADISIGASSSTNISLPITTDGTISKPVSLGRILIAFAGKALARTGQFDEIQFMFHTFNDKASFMRDLSIAKFPCEFDQVQDVITKALKTNLKMSVMQFFQTVISEFVHDTSNVAYGFRQLYEIDEETGEYKRKESTVEGEDEAALAEREAFREQQEIIEDQILLSAGISDGYFKLPRVSVYPECVPHKDFGSKTILRIHVVDETCTSYGTLFELLKATRSADISSFGFSNDPKHPLLSKAPELSESTIQSRRNQTINDLKEKGVIVPLISTITPDPTGASTGISTTVEIDIGKIFEGKSLSQVKRYVSQGVPTILFGRSGGAISNVGLSSLNDPALTTVNIINMNKTTAGTPDLSRNRGLPMQIAPTECTLEMLGCPLLSFGQFFFLDFKTGTTADNIYTVTGIDHKIEAGSFSTTAKLTFLDSYGSYNSPAREAKTTSQFLTTALGLTPTDVSNSDSEEPVGGATTASTANPPPGFVTGLGITDETITQIISSFPNGSYLGVALIVDKTTGGLYRSTGVFPSGALYAIVQTSNKNSIFQSVRNSTFLDPNIHAMIIAPLSRTTTGWISIGVYNVSTGGPSQSSEVEQLFKIGYKGAMYNELSVNFTDWRDAIIRLGL